MLKIWDKRGVVDELGFQSIIYEFHIPLYLLRFSVSRVTCTQHSSNLVNGIWTWLPKYIIYVSYTSKQFSRFMNYGTFVVSIKLGNFILNNFMILYMLLPVYTTIVFCLSVYQALTTVTTIITNLFFYFSIIL